MNQRPSLGNLLYPALVAALAVAAVICTAGTIMLCLAYSRDFPELSGPWLWVYGVGRVGLLFLVSAILLALGAFLFTWALGRLRCVREAWWATRPFAFFVALYTAGSVTLGTLFYVNSNVLRFSREMRSYAIDLLILAGGLILFILLAKILPARIATALRRRGQVLTWTLALLVALSALVGNPFATHLYLPVNSPSTPRNYDSEGHYLEALEAVTPRPLNVLLLSIDTLRFDGLGCCGNPRATSPNIDRLATEGALFTHALAQASWTLPSHMTMFTGLYPSVHGCVTSPTWTGAVDRLSETWTTLPEILSQFGYTTAAFTDGEFVGPTFGFDQGFDICDDSGGGIDDIAPRAIAWLDAHPTDQPFFLFLHCYDVHHYRPPPEDEALFATDYAGPLRALRERGYELEMRLTSDGFYDLTPDDIRYLRALYDAEIRKTDRYFGHVLAALRESGQYENTVIIVTSDHGEEFWEHGGLGHGWSLHQHQLRVPLIIKSPAPPVRGVRIEDWVGLIDLFPTILALLDLPPSSSVAGLSLLPLLHGETLGERSFIAEAAHLSNQKCMVQDAHSFLFNRVPPIGEDICSLRRLAFVWRNILHCSPNELYGLSADPGEMENILPHQAQRGETMKAALLTRSREHLARGLVGAQSEEAMDEQTREHLRSLGYIR